MFNKKVDIDSFSWPYKEADTDLSQSLKTCTFMSHEGEGW